MICYTAACLPQTPPGGIQAQRGAIVDCLYRAAGHKGKGKGVRGANRGVWEGRDGGRRPGGVAAAGGSRGRPDPRRIL